MDSLIKNGSRFGEGVSETFEHAILTAKDHLQHVHLGNCVMKDKADPYYGDRHPPIGYPSGEIFTRDLADILRLLVDIGYLSKNNRGTLVIEARPLPGTSVEETINDQFQCLYQAWQLAGCRSSSEREEK